MVLYCNFRSLAFLVLLGFLTRQLKIKFIATLLSAAKIWHGEQITPFVLPPAGTTGESLAFRPVCLRLYALHLREVVQKAGP